MIETPLRSITNSGTWMLILAPTYSMKIFISRTLWQHMQFPLSIDMLLARDSIIGIFIPSSISLPASPFTRSVIHHLATNSLVTSLARLLLMCITERARDTLWYSEWKILISIHSNSTNTFGDTYRASLWPPGYIVRFDSTQGSPPVFWSCLIS